MTGRGRWIAAAIVLFAAALAPLALADHQVRAVAAALYFALATVGLNVAMGLGGMPSLGQGAFVGLGAFGAAWLRARGGWDAAPAMLAGVAVATGAGIVLGALTTRLPGVYVAVATWIGSWLFAVALAAFPGFSGGTQGLVVATPVIRIPLLGAAVRLTPGVHLQVALWLVVAALLGFRAASRGSPGLGLAAVRTVPSQADALGIDGDRLLLGSFVTSAALGGVAGALSVHLVGVADPTAYGPLLSTELFIAVLLGGPGGTVGPMLGALVLVVTTGAARGLGVAALGPVRYAPAIAAGLLLLALFVRGSVWGGRARFAMLRRIDAKDRPTSTAAAWKGADVEATSDARKEPHELELREVSKRFGGVTASDGVALTVGPGQIHALAGPNGSGKTTLLRIAAGTAIPDAGSVAVGHRDLTAVGTLARARVGVVRTLQRAAVFEGLTVAQHVEAGATPRSRLGAWRTVLATPRARAERDRFRRGAVHLVEEVGLGTKANEGVETLGPGERRLVLVATAAASGPSVLLLDEPAAGMSAPEVDRLAAFLGLLRERGIAILLVEHDFGLIRRIADRVTVLDAGRVIASGRPDEVAAEPAVVRAYLGPE